MEMAYLQEYIALANRRSFTETARALHLTQSTLSKHVAALEREFGVDLFIRDRNGVSLTEAGAVLYRQAVRINRTLQQTKRLLETASDDAVADMSTPFTETGPSTDIRCKSAYVAATYDLTPRERGALVLYLEDRGFVAIQDELGLSRDEVADVLASVYRKLHIDDKQEALDLIHSVSE